MNQRKLLRFGIFWLIGLFAVIIVASVYTGFFSEPTIAPASMTADDYARALVADCANEDYRPFCYETGVLELTTEMETYQIFDVIRAIRTHDPEYVFCHVAAHNLGQHEVALDPENWLDVLAKSPTDGLCSNGFAHGAILARFNDETFNAEELEVIIDEFKEVCEPREGWKPTNLHRAMCYHGLGHVLIHVTETDVNRSLAGCEEIAQKMDGDFRRVCREGVYMQLFQPLEPEDYALIEQLPMQPSRDNIYAFCERYSSAQDEFDTCWREAWPFFQDDIRTAEGIVEYCSVITDQSGEDACYTTAFTINGRHHLGNPAFIQSICDSVSLERQGQCYGVAANAYLEEDAKLIPEGLSLCAMSDTVAVQNECYGYLAGAATFNFHTGSEAHEQLCRQLPVEWTATCRS